MSVNGRYEKEEHSVNFLSNFNNLEKNTKKISLKIVKIC